MTDLKGFRSWLLTTPEPVGTRRSVDDCPIGRYLSRPVGRSSEGEWNVPEWAQGFILALDNPWDGRPYQVTRAEALRLLDSTQHQQG